jgi:hypothetical protein
MTRVVLGWICGLLYGALSSASMLPMAFPDKAAALLGAFLNRLAIGVSIGYAVGPGRRGWLVGLLLGVLISAGDAVITKAYAPIIVMGAAGGALIGWIVSRFGA